MNTTFDLVHRIFNRGRTFEQTRKHKRAMIYKEEEERVISQIPRALPQAHQNILESSLCHAAPQHSQSECLLLTRLPPEIRNRIWTYVLGDYILHFTHINQDIRAFIKPIDENDADSSANGRGAAPDPAFTQIDESTRHYHHPNETPSALFHHSIYPEWARERELVPSESSAFAPPPYLLTLPLTCHAIYAETLPLIYSANVFAFVSPLPLVYILDLPLIPPSHPSLIQHLQLQWTYFQSSAAFAGRIHGVFAPDTWPKFWDLVAKKLTGLRRLGVRVEYWGDESECNVDAEWIQPMLQVRGLQMAECRMESRVGPYTWARLSDVGKQIEQVWMGPAKD